MKRIHYLSCFAEPWRTERYIADALAWYGLDVECYQITDDRDRPGCNGAPSIAAGDLVFTSVPPRVNVQEWADYRAAGAKTACWYFDWVFGLNNRERYYLPALRLMDAVFSTDGFSDAEYQANGITCREWLPQAAPPESRLVEPGPGVPAHDVLFLGRLYNHDRQDIIAALHKDFDVGVYGVQTTGRRIWGRERGAMLRAAKIVFGVSYRDDVPGYWSNRVYLTLSGGGFYLCRRVAGLDTQFVSGKHLATFTGDARAAVAKWLKRDKARQRIRDKGYELVQREHTYTHRVGTLIARLRDRGLL